MPRVLSEASLVCLPTFYGEGLPKALLEAAASARAIVATDVPGCREIVRPGENGWLVPPRDVPALAAALREAIARPRACARYGAAGRRMVEREFSLDAVIGDTLAVYEELRGGRAYHAAREADARVGRALGPPCVAVRPPAGAASACPGRRPASRRAAPTCPRLPNTLSAAANSAGGTGKSRGGRPEPAAQRRHDLGEGDGLGVGDEVGLVPRRLGAERECDRAR